MDEWIYVWMDGWTHGWMEALGDAHTPSTVYHLPSTIYRKYTVYRSYNTVLSCIVPHCDTARHDRYVGWHTNQVGWGATPEQDLMQHRATRFTVLFNDVPMEV